MQIIEAILFEPVGCFADFPSEPFNEIALRLFGRRKRASRSASRTYWHLLNLMLAADKELNPEEKAMVEGLELQAVAGAAVYEDVAPALSELVAMGTRLIVASSLSSPALVRFLDEGSLNRFFPAVWSRDRAGGIKSKPLQNALESMSLKPEATLYLTDTSEGLKVAKQLGVNGILMMNDPDEAKRLALQDPAGGVVSLRELPDFIRVVAAENVMRLSQR